MAGDVIIREEVVWPVAMAFAVAIVAISIASCEGNKTTKYDVEIAKLKASQCECPETQESQE